MNRSQDCRVILVTGGSSGFGKACIDSLADRGHRVYGTSRRAEFPQNGTTSTFPLIIPMDVCDAGSVQAAVDFIIKREGRLDVLVNNAGFGLAGAIEQTSTEEARAQFETNFFGVHRVCCSVLPHMRSQGSGMIVNIGSMGGLIALPFQGFYCASKYALEALTESLRMEVKPLGIRVTQVDPGDFRAGITANRIIAANSHSDPVYSDRQNAAIKVIIEDEQNGTAPEELAILLSNIVEEKQVRPRYLAGMFLQKIAVWSKRLLPASLFERLIMSHYRI